MKDQPDQKLPLSDTTLVQAKTIQNPFSFCCSLVNGKPLYDFHKCLEFLENKGKELFGEHFVIFREDHDVIYKLLVYAIGDQENALKHGLSLKKGLLLIGPDGCGKSSLMKLLRFFQPQHNRYSVRSCRDISFAFIRDGYEIIHQYTYGALHDPFRKYCFVGFGTEINPKYYGNECNVLGEILLNRYELFVAKGLLTHGTSCCNSSEIERFYGNGVRSRMRVMFNLVAFDKDAKDKR